MSDTFRIEVNPFHVFESPGTLLITVCDASGIAISKTIVEPPNFFERLLGITLQRKVDAVVSRYQTGIDVARRFNSHDAATLPRSADAPREAPEP